MTSHRTLLLGAAFIVASAAALAQQPFLAPEHDIRFALSIAPLDDGLQRLDKATFRAGVHQSPQICNSGELQVFVSERPMFMVRGYLNSNDGRFGIDVEVKAKIHGNLEHCSPLGAINIGMPCTLAAHYGPITGSAELLAKGTCRPGAGFFFKDLPLDLRMPMPVSANRELEFRLDPPVDESGLEFGRFDAGTWIAEGLVRRIPFALTMTAIDGARGVVLLDGAIGKTPPKAQFKSEAEAQAAFRDFVPIWADVGLGLSVRSTLFGSVGSTATRRGFFNAILPIRIFGKAPSGGRDYRYELFVTGARAVPAAGTDGQLEIAFSTDRARIWETRGGVAIGDGHLVEALEIGGRVSMPRLNPATNELEVEITKLWVRLDTCIGDVEVRLRPGDLAKSLNKGLVGLAKLESSSRFDLPDCLALESSGFEITASRVCADGVRRNRLSNISLEKNFQLDVDFSHPRARVDRDALQIGLPMLVKP